MNIETILSVVESAKYPFLFVIYLLEGPLAGFLSAAAASLGHLNIYIVWILVIIGEVLADYFFFYLGRKSRHARITRKINELDTDLLKELRRLSEEKLFWVLVILKNSVIFYLPGFLFLGASKKIKDWQYILYVSIICVIKDSIIIALGYFTGLEVSKFEQIYEVYAFIGIFVFVGAVIFVLTKVYREQIKEFTSNIIKNKI